MTECKLKLMTTKNMAKMGILGAVAVAYVTGDTSAFLPSFYEVDLSEVAVLLGAFSMGPVAGVIIEAIKILLILLLPVQLLQGRELANS